MRCETRALVPMIAGDIGHAAQHCGLVIGLENLTKMDDRLIWLQNADKDEDILEVRMQPV